MEEVKSSSKIILRSKNIPVKKILYDPYMLTSSVGCLVAIFLKSQFLLFGFLISLLSCILTDRHKNSKFNYLTPLYGIIPPISKITYDVFRCLISGEKL